MVVWLSGFAKPLSRLGLCRFETYTKGRPLKILLVGYNGARNTGADARVVALTQQLEQALGTDHQRYWSLVTRRTFEVMQQMGFDPQPMPKLLRPSQCRLCGHCSIGCPTRAKWDTRELLEGIQVVTGCQVTRIDIGDGKARKVYATKSGQTLTFEADLILVAAGGYGTPDILRVSGIDCQPNSSSTPCSAWQHPWIRYVRITSYSCPLSVDATITSSRPIWTGSASSSTALGISLWTGW